MGLLGPLLLQWKCGSICLILMTTACLAHEQQLEQSLGPLELVYLSSGAPTQPPKRGRQMPSWSLVSPSLM